MCHLCLPSFDSFLAVTVGSGSAGVPRSYPYDLFVTASSPLAVHYSTIAERGYPVGVLSCPRIGLIRVNGDESRPSRLTKHLMTMR